MTGRSLFALWALALLLAVSVGCGKEEAGPSTKLPDKVAKGDAGDAEEAPADAEVAPARRGTEVLFWGGDGVGDDNPADSFGPAGPAPVLLFGAEVAKGNAQLSGDAVSPEVRGSLVMAQQTGPLAYERDDDIDATWLELPIPPGPEDAVQHFAGMAVWGSVTFILSEPVGDLYEAEAAVYLLKLPYDQVVASLTPSGDGLGLLDDEWRRVDAPTALRADRSDTYLRVRGESVHEVSLAEFVDLGLVQVTMARVRAAPVNLLAYVAKEYGTSVLPEEARDKLPEDVVDEVAPPEGGAATPDEVEPDEPGPSTSGGTPAATEGSSPATEGPDTMGSQGKVSNEEPIT